MLCWSVIKWNCISTSNLCSTKFKSCACSYHIYIEGVWAAVFGWIILEQYLNEIKIIGILLILTAVIFSQLATIYGKKKYG